MNNQRMQPRVSTDRFGQPYQLKKMVNPVNKKDGTVYEDIWYTYVTLNGNDYKIEVSPSNKETKNGYPTKWVKVTKMSKKQQSNARM